MKLSDIMGAAGLASYAEVGLVIFLAVFVAVAARLALSDDPSLGQLARLPLEDDVSAPPPGGARSAILDEGAER